MVYHYARNILGLYSQMNQLVKDLKDDASGTLTIGASFTFGEYVLPHIIAEFRKKYPKIDPTIQIVNAQIIAKKIARGELDIVWYS